MPASLPGKSLWLTKLFVTFLALQDLASGYVHEDSKYGKAAIDARKPGPSTTGMDQPTSTSSAAAQTHTVQVGLADHKFRPEVTMAEIGDTIEFRFYPTNHSVVRAEYGYPCIPYEMTGSNKQGFFSGFHAVDKVLDDPAIFNLRITDTEPIFFYCSAPGSCITYGMVGAINPNSSTSIDTQRQLAWDSAYMLNPGEPFPHEAPLPSNIPISSTPPATPATSHTKPHGLPPGVIAAIAAAGLVLIVLASVMFFLWQRTKTLKEKVESRESSAKRRRNSSTSSTANMLQTPLLPTVRSPEPGSNLAGLGIFPQPTQSQATLPTSPLSPQQQQQHQQQQLHNLAPISTSYLSPTPPDDKSYVPEPQGHPALSPYTLHFPTTIFPSAHQTNHNHNNSNSTHSRTTLLSPLHPTNHPYPPRTTPSTPPKLGPYGHQEATRLGLLTSEPAPPSYGWHVNSHLGPAEMDGSPVSASASASASVSALKRESESQSQIRSKRMPSCLVAGRNGRSATRRRRRWEEVRWNREEEQEQGRRGGQGQRDRDNNEGAEEEVEGRMF